jgi:hypothetical protein
LGGRRSGCEAEQAKRRNGGDAAKKTAPRRNFSALISEIAHLFLPVRCAAGVFEIGAPSHNITAAHLR